MHRYVSEDDARRHMAGLRAVHGLPRRGVNVGKPPHAAVPSEYSDGAVGWTSDAVPLVKDGADWVVMSSERSPLLAHAITDGAVNTLDGGVYVADATARLASGTAVVGTGETTVVASGELVGHVFEIDGAVGCSISNLRIDGRAEERSDAWADWHNHSHGIAVYDGSEHTVSGVAISDTPYDGVYLGTRSSRGEDRPSGITLDRVVVRRARRQGIAIVAGEDVALTECVTAECGPDNRGKPTSGVDIETNPYNRVSHVSAVDCVSERNTGNGFYVLTAGYGSTIQNISVVGGRFSQNGKSGVRVVNVPTSGETVSGVDVSGVEANDNASTGVLLSGIDSASLRSCTTRRNLWFGMLVNAGCSSVEVEDSTSTENGRASIKCEDTSGLTIRRCDMSPAPDVSGTCVPYVNDDNGVRTNEPNTNEAFGYRGGSGAIRPGGAGQPRGRA